MKTNTGIVRKLDNLGRIVIPKEMRKILEINDRDSLEISVENETITLKKYQNKCTFCGELNPQNQFKDKKVCNKCLNEIKKGEK